MPRVRRQSRLLSSAYVGTFSSDAIQFFGLLDRPHKSADVVPDQVVWPRKLVLNFPDAEEQFTDLPRSRYFRKSIANGR